MNPPNLSGAIELHPPMPPMTEGVPLPSEDRVRELNRPLAGEKGDGDGKATDGRRRKD